MSTQLVEVARVEDVPPGHAARLIIEGVPVALFNVGGDFHALDDTCTHAEASLSEGELDVDECTIECPLHGSTFDVRSGEPLSLPAVIPVRVHDVVVEDCLIKVALNHD
jgi:3-phenylpropionate/trans-cinnamate dioxygenase ferredoxin subunit